jgi:protein-disulfide isomerase
MMQRAARAGLGTCLTLFALACQQEDSGSPPGTAPAADPRSELVAEVSGVPITTAELDAWIKEDLFRNRASSPARLYEMREEGLEHLVEERLIEIEASRRGVEPDEVIPLEVEALGPVSDEEVEAFFEENREKLGGATLEQVRPRIRSYLLARRQSDAVTKLREGASVTILLEPPRFSVSTDGPSRGPADARVTIVEFSDFECPFCRRVLPTLEQILERYPEDVRLVYRHLPLNSHRRARPAAEAALCARDQEGFWPYHDKLFENSRALEDEDLLRYAQELDLDAQRFERCLKERTFEQQVDADVQEARAAGITGTPAFLVNGVLVSGARPVADFARVIDTELARLASPPGS